MLFPDGLGPEGKKRKRLLLRVPRQVPQQGELLPILTIRLPSKAPYRQNLTRTKPQII